jgi:hypothetical protein
VERDRQRQVADRANEMKTLLSGMNDFAMSAKILAINARVEATRAGDHGRAFGVVAEEMSRVADTTKTTADLGVRGSLVRHVDGMERAQGAERVALDAVAGEMGRLSAAPCTRTRSSTTSARTRRCSRSGAWKGSPGCGSRTSYGSAWSRSSKCSARSTSTSAT